MATSFGGTRTASHAGNGSPALTPPSVFPPLTGPGGGGVILTTGTFSLTGTLAHPPSMVALQGSSVASEPTIVLRGASIDTTVTMAAPPGNGAVYGQIDVAGSTTLGGPIIMGGHEIGPGHLAIDIAPKSTFIDTGTIDSSEGSTLVIRGPSATFENDGTVSASDGYVTIDAAVIGSGTFVVGGGLGTGSEMRFSAAVGAESTVSFALLNNEMVLNDPVQFQALITGFGPFDSIILPGAQADTYSYSDNLLTLYDNGSVIAGLHLAGSYNSADFQVKSGPNQTEVSYGTPAIGIAQH